MTNSRNFDLNTFLPYLLNQAAEATSRGFQSVYAAEFGMTRTQWRVLANLGKFGSMTAKDICRISHIEKTKVSRAISALEQIGHLRRCASTEDRRAEILSLTDEGRHIFAALGRRAQDFDLRLRAELGSATAAELEDLLKRLVRLNSVEGRQP